MFTVCVYFLIAVACVYFFLAAACDYIYSIVRRSQLRRRVVRLMIGPRVAEVTRGDTLHFYFLGGEPQFRWSAEPNDGPTVTVLDVDREHGTITAYVHSLGAGFHTRDWLRIFRRMP